MFSVSLDRDGQVLLNDILVVRGTLLALESIHYLLTKFLIHGRLGIISD